MPIEVVLWLWCVAYSGFHIFITVNIYDRYLLPLLPMLAVVIAISLQKILVDKLVFRSFIFVMILAIFLQQAWQVNQGDIHVGGDLGKHQGIDELAEYLNQKPVATVIYDHWLGWELGYYMGQWTNKRRVYYPDANSMVADAVQLQESGDRYFIAPTQIPIDEWLQLLEQADFRVNLEYQTKQFVVYRLTPLFQQYE